MKFMAIGTVIRPVSPEERGEIMPHEVPATLKLYLDGVIEQFWARQDKPGVIFLINAEAADEARAAVEALPLVTRGVATYEVIPVGPLAPLGLLIKSN